MTNYSITVQPEKQHFNCNESEAILSAALREGIQLPYGCRGGSCGACKVQLLEGDITYGDSEPEALTDKETAGGWILPCQAQPQSDVVIKAKEISQTKDIPIKNLPSRVMHMEQLTHDVMGIWLKLPTTERLQFLAGQYIDVLMNDGKERSFSLANAPHDDEFLQLQVRYYDGGVFSEIVFNEMKEKTLLRIKGPFGNFFLRENSERHSIFIAGGTGFAPIKGIIEHMIAKGDKRKVSLYWGARAKRDLYMDQLAKSWATDHDHIEYIPVLSEPVEEDNWKGKTGFVHEAILEDHKDFSDKDIYASGPPIMVQSIHKSFLEYGMNEERLYSDAFEFAATKK